MSTQRQRDMRRANSSMGDFAAPRNSTSHVGIRRSTAPPRPPRPLTPRQRAVLAVLTPEPQGVAALARQLHIAGSGVSSAVLALSARGLADHAAGRRGWRLAPGYDAKDAGTP